MRQIWIRLDLGHGRGVLRGARAPARAKRAIRDALLERHGRTFTRELHIDVAKGTPPQLFRLHVLSILLSARIGHDLAMVDAARAPADRGWTTVGCGACRSSMPMR